MTVVEYVVNRYAHIVLYTDEDDNSNSSNDSDQLQASGYHSARQSEATNLVCRHESISISAMEDCPTDHEVCVCVYVYVF